MVGEDDLAAGPSGVVPAARGSVMRDVALVSGANDVVTPAARTDPTSPIHGMPILNVDEAKSVVVMKRSMNPGFAGIDNALFYLPRTSMLFGDAKASLQKLVAEVKLASGAGH